MNKFSVIDLFDNAMNFELIDVRVIENIVYGKVEFGEAYNIEEFDFDGAVVKMVKDDGYRGVGCYEGMIEKNGQLYIIDVLESVIEEVFVL